jgi:hypothetical protein
MNPWILAAIGSVLFVAIHPAMAAAGAAFLVLAVIVAASAAVAVLIVRALRRFDSCPHLRAIATT